jgi:hypothetical protein
MSEPSLRSLLFTGSRRERARWAVRLVTPVGIELIFWKRSIRAARREAEPGWAREIAAGGRAEAAIRFLVDHGLDEQRVRDGSIPGTSLDYMAETVRDRLPRDRPVRALHVGNFVGVSLCYVSWLVAEHHPDSVVVSIDPNLTHRGVDNPQSHVFALLDNFGLLDRNAIITGYSLGRTEEEAGPGGPPKWLASENVLGSLHGLVGPGFDLVLLDGSHEEDYLRREITAVRPLLSETGIVVFDDVREWAGVAAVFREVAGDKSFEELGEDGRVGILQLKARTPTGA